MANEKNITPYEFLKGKAKIITELPPTSRKLNIKYTWTIDIEEPFPVDLVDIITIYVRYNGREYKFEKVEEEEG